MNLLYVLIGSTVQSSISTLISLVCAFPLLHMVRGVSYHTRVLLCSFCFILAIMPGTVAAITVTALRSTSGICSIILAHLLLNIPLAFHVVSGDFFRINTTLYTMARSLGASRVRSYYDGVLVPLLPSLISAAVMIFIMCFSSTSIPLLLGDSVWSNTLDSALVLLYSTDNIMATMLCTVIRLMMMLVIVLWGSMLSRAYTVSYKSVPLLEDRTPSVHTGWSIAGYNIVGCLLVPLVWVCVRYVYSVSHCYTHIHDIFGESLFFITARSVIIAVLSSTTAIVFSLYLFYKQHRYAQLYSAVPWLIGGSACAVVAAMIVSYVPMISFVMVIGCHAILCIPFIIRMITIAYHQYDAMWTAYAHSCGATRQHVFFTLQLPYIKEALCASWSLSFGLSIAQVGVSQLLADSIGMTLPAAIRILKTSKYIDEAIILSILSMLLVCIPTLLVQWYSSGYNRVTQLSPSPAAIRKRVHHSI